MGFPACLLLFLKRKRGPWRASFQSGQLEPSKQLGVNPGLEQMPTETGKDHLLDLIHLCPRSASAVDQQTQRLRLVGPQVLPSAKIVFQL